MNVTMIESGPNWMNIRGLISSNVLGFPLLPPIKVIVDENMLSIYASTPNEVAFLAINNISLAGSFVVSLDAEGYNSANYLLGLSPFFCI